MAVDTALSLWRIVFAWAQLPISEFQTGKHFIELINSLG
jgi:hypothetical protein